MSSAARIIIKSITRLSSTYNASLILSSNHHLLLRPQSLGDPRYLSNYSRLMNYYNTRGRHFSAQNSVQPAGAPLPPPRPPSFSMRWLLGIFLTIVLPFAGNKYGPLLQFKNEVDTAVETIEEIVVIVEKVAEVVDKVAEDISGGLPEGGKFKKVVDIVEHMAEQTAEDAQRVEHAIDKLQEVEQKVESIVGTLISDKAKSIPKT